MVQHNFNPWQVTEDKSLAMNVYFVTLLILVFYLVLAWIAGALLRLQGASLWLLRGSLMFIGVLAAALFLWFHHRLKRRTESAPSQFARVSEQLKFLLRQAEQKLAMGKQGSLRSLPIVFVLGDLNSAKTSSIIHSGLEPELIAGHVFRDSDVVPTATVNVWFARKTVFIEAGGKLAANAQLWAQLLRQTRPKSVTAAVGTGQQAPRAALVCLDCEHLSSAQSSAQNLANRIKEMAYSLGAPFPVYVLFTKLDRVPHFAEYVSNLTPEESAQILGVTLPRATGQGVFAEEEGRRLARAFDQIIYSLAEKRLDFLSRETLAEKTGAIYEFPRELGKSRNQVVQLLVDLTRPTQLSANPFLRGFYFSGVRAVIVNEAVSTPAIVRTATAAGSGATRMFNYAEEARAAAQNVPQRTVQSRKIPQWTFLPHLFTEVVLADRVAFAASHQSTKVDGLRRGLLAFAAVVLLSFAVLFLISFVRNRGLENDIAGDAQHLNAISPGSTIETPTVEQLRNLDELRNSVDKLKQHQTSGAPWSYRFGLYSGDRIYPEAYSLYFQNFRRFLLIPAQSKMVAVLNQTPATRSTDDFQRMYNTLKAYLITTSNHEHADWNSFVPVLLDNSPALKNPDPESQTLIRRQIDFYAGILAAANPYPPENDKSAVERAQAYLKQFGIQVIYQAMLEDAAKGKQPVNFDRRFPQQYVKDGYEVSAAFTKDGYAVMQKSLQNPEKFTGEDWVLGAPTATLGEPAASLRDKLTTLYVADYAKAWRGYLRNGLVLGFGGLKEASTRLGKLSENDSPLLQLFWLAKENTAVDIPDLKNSFQAVQMISQDSTLDRLLGSGNQEYMKALSNLQNTVKSVVDTPNGTTDSNRLVQVQQDASTANGTVSQIQQRFTVDTQGGADRVDVQVTRLLREPIDYVKDAAIRAQGSGAQDLCTIANAVTSKRPFNSRSNKEATLQEVQNLFGPQGMLWTSVAKLGVQRQGSNWVNGPTPQSPSFLSFLNHAQQFADTLFPNGSQTVHLSFSLRRLPSPGIDKATLAIDGQSLTDVGATQKFTWQGGESSASLSAGGQNLPRQGPWAIFDFFDEADWTGQTTLSFPIRIETQLGHHSADQTKPIPIPYELTVQGASVFRKDFRSSLHCSAR